MERITSFIWPIRRNELGKFVPMALMLCLTIFNYNTLKTLKDSLIVPAIGAEAISFVKVYFVVPAAILFVLLYMRLANRFFFKQIYIGIGLFYVIYFLIFAFILYPNQDFIHPKIVHIGTHYLNQSFLGIDLSHFRWFLELYSKWMYVVFYVLAELWGSSMTFLLFWQFSNQIVATEQSKRFYPMINLFGSFGTFMAGITIQYFANIQARMEDDGSAIFVVQNLLSLMAVSTICILVLFWHMYHRILKKETDYSFKDIKKKLPFLESIRTVLSSRYLGYVVILVLAYGFTMNLVEGPWKAKIGELYPTTNSYVWFMGTVHQWSGILSILFSIIGVSILRYYGWFVTAIITPIMMFVTGTGFFAFVVFGKSSEVALGSLIAVSPLALAVLFGTIQNVLSKSSKYGLFDSTKEMTYIPIDEELKSKGKAAVDVIGARVAKSGGAFIQSLLFMIFPTATYTTISPILMVILIIVSVIWMVDVKLLSQEYSKYLNKVGIK